MCYVCVVFRIVEVSGASWNDEFEGKTLGEQLITPTRIYVKPLLELMKSVDIKALSEQWV